MQEHQQLAWLQNQAIVLNFRLQLSQLTSALEPLARACKCLEAAQSNVSDVFVFWLAIMATYTELFRTNNYGYPESVICDIRAILNVRYAEMMGGVHGTLYLAGFFLNPGKYLQGKCRQLTIISRLYRIAHSALVQPEPTGNFHCRPCRSAASCSSPTGA